MQIVFQNQNLPEKGFHLLSDAMRVRLAQRGVVLGSTQEDALVLSLAINTAFDADSFRIYDADGVTHVEANNLCTVFAAVGHYFVKGCFDHKGGFQPAALPISHKMKNSLRGFYFATHFYNFYHAAPIEEVYDKIIDLALRGCNCLMLCFGVQHYTGMDTTEAVTFVARMKQMLKFADQCGIAPALILFSNTGFADSYHGIEAQCDIDDSGRYTRNNVAEFNTEICPNAPGGMEEIERQQRAFFAAFADTPIKYFALWAYDEGGCLCEKCYPWVTNGFMKVAELSRRLIKEYGYDAEIILSTWHFDVRKADEWEIFYEELAKGTYAWSPYIMTAFRSGEMHKVFLEKGVPAGVRLIDFPEISMCHAKPWGGFGANPITLLLDKAHQNCGSYHDGGFPYAEGIYPDVNTWVCLGFYAGYYENSADAVRDYIRFELGVEDTEDLLRAIQLMETTLYRDTQIQNETGAFQNTAGLDGIHFDATYRFPIRETIAIPEIYRIVTTWNEKIPAGLKDSFKWRLLYLRGVIDNELLKNKFITKHSEVAQRAYHEMHQISHTWDAKFCVHPPEGM